MITDRTLRCRTNRRHRRVALELGRIEILESRRLLTFASPFASPTNPGSFGINGSTVDVPATSGDMFVHNFYAVLNNDAGLPTATLNATALTPDGHTVNAQISGNVVGPLGFPFDFHTKEVDFFVNGTEVPLASLNEVVTQGPTGADTRESANYSATIPLAAGQSTDSINFVLRDRTQEFATPQIHLFDIAVDTNTPTIASVGPVTSPTITPVSSVPVSLSEAINPATFTTSNLALTLNGNPVSLAGSSVTLTPVSGSATNFTIGGLSTVTKSPGNYQLTVNAKGIKDTVGNPGAGSSSVSFVVQSPPVAPPVISSVVKSKLITVKFGQSLSTSSANNPANYVILQIVTGHKKRGPVIHVKAAAYNPSTQSVTLTTKPNLAAKTSYQLTINGSTPGGLTDSSNALLGKTFQLKLTSKR